MDVDLEHGRMIPGFIEGVIGMKHRRQQDRRLPVP